MCIKLNTALVIVMEKGGTHAQHSRLVQVEDCERVQQKHDVLELALLQAHTLGFASSKRQQAESRRREQVGVSRRGVHR